MNDILKKAQEYLQDATRRAIAHEKSGEWHRHMGEVLGISATALSAVVGSAVIVTITKQLGIDGQAKISLPTGGWEAWLLYFFFGLLLISSPVLSGIQTYINNPEQAKRHRSSSAGYYEIQRKLELFLLRYSKEEVTSATRDNAIKELDEISKEMKAVFSDSISLAKGTLPVDTCAECVQDKGEA